MSDKPISPLRQRMIDDMTARRFGEDTQRDYVRHVRNFTAFLGRSPDTATSEDLRRYQLHLAKQQISPGSINAAGTALRFFFKVTLERPDLVRHLAPVQRPRTAPVVLSEEEVARLLESAPSLKYKAALVQIIWREQAPRAVARGLQASSTAFQTAGATRPWPPRRPSANCPLRMRCISSMPAMVMAAFLNPLKPSITAMRCFTPRCSIRLFRYFDERSFVSAGSRPSAFSSRTAR
jgi:Phage integrase, N-terminal SAM-like domain